MGRCYGCGLTIGWSEVECQLSSMGNKIDDGIGVELMVVRIWIWGHRHRQWWLPPHSAAQSVTAACKVAQGITVCISLEEFALQGHLGIVLQ